MIKFTENLYIGQTLRIISNTTQFKNLQGKCKGYSELRMRHLPGCLVTVKHIDRTCILVKKRTNEYYLHPESFENDNLDDDPIFNAISKDQEEEILKLLNENNLDVLNQNGKTPLHHACSLGKLNIVKLLAEFKPNLNIPGNDVNNLFYTCAANGYHDIIEFLMTKLPYINPQIDTRIEVTNILNSQFKNGLNERNANYQSDNLDDDPIFNAISKDQEEEILKLLNENNLDVLNESGKTPLHHACSLGKLNIVKLLSEFTPNLNIPGNDVNNLFYTCAAKGFDEIIEFLMKKYPYIYSPIETSIEVTNILNSQNQNLNQSSTPNRERSDSPFETIQLTSVTPEPNPVASLSNIQNQLICQICIDSAIQIAFNCGHVVCNNCRPKLILCPFCRKPITLTMELYLNN